MKWLGLLLCFPLAALAAPDNFPKVAQTLDSIVAARFKPEAPGVVALVLKDGRPILRKAYGMANVELNVQLQPAHVFRIGSTTKLFTATEVMLLVEDGKLALDAPGGYIFNFYSQLEMDIDSSIVAVTLHNGDKFGGDNEELSEQLIAAVQKGL